jgi:hypothetical protein
MKDLRMLALDMYWIPIIANNNMICKMTIFNFKNNMQDVHKINPLTHNSYKYNHISRNVDLSKEFINENLL